MLERPLLRSSVNSEDDVLIRVSRPSVYSKPKKSTKPKKTKKPTIPKIPAELITLILDYCESVPAFALLKTWRPDLKPFVEAYCGNKRDEKGELMSEKFMDLVTLEERTPAIIANLNREVKSRASKACLSNIFSCLNINIAIAALLTAGSTASWYYWATVQSPNASNAMDARTRESNLLYRYLQVENVGIFNFTDQNKTLKNCTIIRDLPCYSNCTVGVKSCDAWDPYMLECGHPGSFFVSSGSFGSWLSQTLRDKNPVPYSSPLDIRLRNGPNSSAATLDAYIASCMYYLREDNDIAFKLFLVIMGTVLAFAWDCVVLINCSTSTLGKGCDRQKALEEEMDSLFSRWLKKTSHAAEYQKLIPYLESESKVQDVADETTMIKAIQKGRDEILEKGTENDNNWKANHGIKIITAEEVKEEKEVKVEEVKVEEVKVEEVKEEKEVLLTAAYALFFKKPEKQESTEVVAPKKSGFCNIL